MFTGIVEEVGAIKNIKRGQHSAVLTIHAKTVLEETRIGDSIAVNGICLTVTQLFPDGFSADVMHETLNRSSLAGLTAGSVVNLERAMPADGRFGGHIVAGHVDGVGHIANIRKDDTAVWYTVLAGPEILRYVVEKGSITGMIGPNGAGKSTTFNMICGYYPPTEGKIFYNGEDITNKKAYEYTNMKIARTFQIMKPLKNLSVLDNVTAAAYFGHAGAKSEKEAKERAMEVLHFTGLYEKRHVISKDMGTPDQKRLEMARALATKPEVLFLDENMAGLNPAETEEAIQLIRKINESGVTILLIEHHMDLVMGIADRIYVLDFGKLIAQGTPEEIQNNERVIDAYLGVADDAED